MAVVQVWGGFGLFYNRDCIYVGSCVWREPVPEGIKPDACGGSWGYIRNFICFFGIDPNERHIP